MQASALRRIKVNLCYFNNFAKRFSDNVTANKEKEPPGEILAPITSEINFKRHTPYTLEIKLNSPKRLNSLNIKMIKSLLRRVRQWVPDSMDSASSEEEHEKEKVKRIPDEEEDPKVIIMTGEGKAFCSGGDIVTLYNLSKEGNYKAMKDFFRYLYFLIYQI